MTVRRHRRYSTDFKIQVVQAYLDGEGSFRGWSRVRPGSEEEHFRADG